jgi:hypothetical protein
MWKTRPDLVELAKSLWGKKTRNDYDVERVLPLDAGLS